MLLGPASVYVWTLGGGWLEIVNAQAWKGCMDVILAPAFKGIMKITLEGTDEVKGKVIIIHGSDDLDVHDFWEVMVKPLMLAWSYSPDSIDRMIEELNT